MISLILPSIIFVLAAWFGIRQALAGRRKDHRRGDWFERAMDRLEEEQ